ncbi:GDSL-type esterase/lipase family protein [Paraburkholderia phytofirmans]|uniref:SGNH/GDSL hydrolase family protein n=1 Tax=Paraburkholderia phytofirmans TaxID=261302 RepID=UPI0038B913EE
MKARLIAVLLMACSAAAYAVGPRDVISRPLYTEALREQLDSDQQVPNSAILLFGDSIIHNIPNAKEIDQLAVNYGIVGDTTAGIAHRVPLYTSRGQAAVIVLEGGVNNLGFGTEYDSESSADVRTTLTSISPRVHVVAVGAFPVDESTPKARAGWNGRILRMNEEVKRVCETFANCTFVDIGKMLMGPDGNLACAYHPQGDGIHLTSRAYGKVIVPELKRAVRNAQR